MGSITYGCGRELVRIVLASARKSYRIGLLLTHKNDDFSAISVTERSCTAPISKVERHTDWDRSCATLWGCVNTGIPTVVAVVKRRSGGLEPTGVRTVIYFTKPSRLTAPNTKELKKV